MPRITQKVENNLFPLWSSKLNIHIKSVKKIQDMAGMRYKFVEKELSIKVEITRFL